MGLLGRVIRRLLGRGDDPLPERRTPRRQLGDEHASWQSGRRVTRESLIRGRRLKE